MRNSVITRIIPNIRQRLEQAPPSPSMAGSREAPVVCTSCSANHVPGGWPHLHIRSIVPQQGHTAPCPFPVATAGLSARGGRASQE